ncbi:hypothetical protein, partial [Chitinophaga sp.]|uniref:hypothetical protein n=1 Tax=Chitinophaga sp. TaxID=1869181 RepID=UPI002F95BF08
MKRKKLFAISFLLLAIASAKIANAQTFTALLFPEGKVCFKVKTPGLFLYLSSNGIITNYDAAANG